MTDWWEERVRPKYNDVEEGPVWPYERANWMAWKQQGRPSDMMLILSDGSIFWSCGNRQPNIEMTPFHVRHDGYVSTGYGQPSLRGFDE